MQKGKLNVVLDGQWGSTGKGKLCAYLAEKHDVDVATCDFQTNAGHTVVSDQGEKTVFQQLPVSAIKQTCKLLVNPGATVTLKKLLDEIEMVGCHKRLMIHPHVAIVNQKALDLEQVMLKRIASTLKGVGATLGMKAMRHPDLQLAKDVPELAEWIGDTTEELHRYMKLGAMCMAEAAQGFDLSINHGFVYPYVTSRDITTASVLSNAGVPPQLVGDVYGCIRTYPIRVGNHMENGVLLGTSGPYYEDQAEITWEDLKDRSGSSKSIEEITTVTKKVRRVFTFSSRQFLRFLRVCYPTHIFINFVNHLDASITGARTWSQMTEPVKAFVKMVEADCSSLEYAGLSSPIISHLGTGEKQSDMVTIWE